MNIQVPWTWEPVERAGRVFEGAWKWLESIGAADWDAVHSLARHFHPDYSMDQKKRCLLPNLAPGATVYLQMEKGEFSPEWINAVAPTLSKMLPKNHRSSRAGGPTEYLLGTLFLAAMLACHEFALLDAELRKDQPDARQIARHLYFFERFAGLWVRTGQSKPASVDLNHEKRRVARQWRSELLAFHRNRVAAHKDRRVSARESALEWVNGRQTPSFEVAYRALQAELRNA